MTKRDGARERSRRCVVIHPDLGYREDSGTRSSDARLAEVVGLTGAIDLVVIHAEIVRLTTVRPSTLLGSGVVDRLKSWFGEREEADEPPVDVVIIDHALSPIQQRNLERAWSVKVIDRTALILEIFGARARTAEGVLQVELAALSYQRSRLVRSWTHLERQRGGFGFLGGPGETQLETDRRLIRDRIRKLERDLAQVRRTRGLHRDARQRVPYPVIALVGYTNAGKSTLFNRLTRADVYVEDQLFATLDPTMRSLDLPSGRKAILSDTVGFISDLPHELIEAFRATLEEVTSASIVVHVRDASHPDSEAQKADVESVLSGLGVETEAGTVVEAFNKIDLMPAEHRETLANQVARQNGGGTLISARTGEGCDRLLDLLDQRLAGAETVIQVQLDPREGAALAWLYAHGEVLKRDDSEAALRVSVRLLPARAAQFARQFGRPEVTGAPVAASASAHSSGSR